MPIDLYHMQESSPCRAVRLVAAAVGVELNLKLIDVLAKDQFKPEFLKINPQHTIPTLDDNGFHLAESHAISIYLVEQYAKDDSLYPRDPKQRAIINQRIYFDLGVLFQSFLEYYASQFLLKAPADPAKLEKVKEAFGYLEHFLDGQIYVAGKSLTIADLILATSVSNFPLFDDIDLHKHPNTRKWLSRIESEAPKYKEINGEGLKAFKVLLERLMKK